MSPLSADALCIPRLSASLSACGCAAADTSPFGYARCQCQTFHDVANVGCLLTWASGGSVPRRSSLPEARPQGGQGRNALQPVVTTSDRPSSQLLCCRGCRCQKSSPMMQQTSSSKGLSVTTHH